MLATGLSYMIPESRMSLGIIATFMFLFVASYSPAQGESFGFLVPKEAVAGGKAIRHENRN